MRLHEDTITVIRRMREILTPEGAWIKHSLAKDANGISCLPSNKSATCFCLEGAFLRATRELGIPPHHVLPHNELTMMFPCNIPAWNDAESTTHADVLAKLDEILADPVR